MVVAPGQVAGGPADVAVLSSARHASTGSDLLDAMLALRVRHPSRAGLRSKAIEAWLLLAEHLANRYTGRGEPTDDLIQTATIG